MFILISLTLKGHGTAPARKRAIGMPTMTIHGLVPAMTF
jgi:hypothetical protein